MLFDTKVCVVKAPLNIFWGGWVVMPLFLSILFPSLDFPALENVKCVGDVGGGKSPLQRGGRRTKHGYSETGQNLCGGLLDGLAELSALLLLEEHDVEAVEVRGLLSLLGSLDLLGPGAGGELGLGVDLLPHLHDAGMAGTAGKLGEDDGGQSALAVSESLAGHFATFDESLANERVQGQPQRLLGLKMKPDKPCCGQ